MKRSGLVWVLVIAGVLVAVFSAVLIIGAVMMSEDSGFSGIGGGRIAVIPVEGVINDETAKRINRHLKTYSTDSRVRAILLRIDSPGGGVAASQEIYREVKRAKEEHKKPIVVSMGTVAASGGYYISCPANRIIANPGTITGSIGVIAEWLNYKDLVGWAKMKPEVFKSGEFKDTGSPTREMSEREKQYFQGMITELYNQFVKAVADGRSGRKSLDEAQVRKLADGRVFTGQAALENGLVDEIGNYEDALKSTATLVGIKGEPQVVTPPKPREGFSIWDLLTESKLESLIPKNIPQAIGEVDTSVRFKYQWK